MSADLADRALRVYYAYFFRKVGADLLRRPSYDVWPIRPQNHNK
jgi:hypothetical protein